MVKIANKNKKDAYRRFIGRTGKGSTRMPDRDFNKRLLDIMHAKPYGGIQANKASVKEGTAPAGEDNDTSVRNAENEDATTSGEDVAHGSDKTKSPD